MVYHELPDWGVLPVDLGDAPASAAKLAQMPNMTASEFIRSQPPSMSARDVIATGARRGLKFSANLVYKIRSKGSVGRVARGRPPRQSLSTAPSGVDPAIRARIDNFLAEITELARASVVDAVRESLEPGGAPRRRGPGRPRGSGRPRAARRPKGAKRSPEELAKTTAQLHAAIKSKPGLRIEQLSQKLGVSAPARVRRVS